MNSNSEDKATTADPAWEGIIGKVEIKTAPSKVLDKRPGVVRVIRELTASETHKLQELIWRHD